MKVKKPHILKLILGVLVVLPLFFSYAEDDVRRLEDNISTLKTKIRTSNSKDPKDIQKLYKLENELEKKVYLQKNKAR